MTLAGSGSDPEGEAIVSYAWIAPDDLTLTGADTATPSFTAPQDLVSDAQLEFSLVVSDASGNASVNVDNRVSITVTANNQAPSAHAGPDQTVADGTLVTLDGRASSDPEGEDLSYAWTPPAGVTLDDPTSATPRFSTPQLLEDAQLDQPDGQRCQRQYLRGGAGDDHRDGGPRMPRRASNAGDDQTVAEGATGGRWTARPVPTPRASS